MWLEGNGNLDEAFRHALASRDMAWAADMIERNVQTMINMGEMSALARWIGRLPEEITHKRPLLSLGLCLGADRNAPAGPRPILAR